MTEFVPGKLTNIWNSFDYFFNPMYIFFESLLSDHGYAEIRRIKFPQRAHSGFGESRHLEGLCPELVHAFHVWT